MEEEQMETVFQIALPNGETIMFPVEPDETMEQFRDRLQETLGFTISVDDILAGSEGQEEESTVVTFLPESFEELANAEEELVEDGLNENEGIENGINETVEILEPGHNLSGVFCAVPGCSSNKIDNPNLTLFRFPAQKKRCMSWVAAIKREDLAKETVHFLSSRLSVCANHFTMDQFASKERRILKQTAVPNTRLDEIKVEEEPEESFQQELPLMDLEPDLSERFESEVVDAEGEEEEIDESHPGTLCRLCAKEISALPQYIFEPNIENKTLADIINSCLPVSVTKTDVLPKQICIVCRQKLMEQNSFAETCLEAQEKLIQMTRRFLVEDKRTVDETITQTSDVNHSCPLCCQGEMRCLAKDGELVPKGANTEDSIVGLYSDEAETDEEDKSKKELDLVYLADERNFSFDCGICEESFPNGTECLHHCKTHESESYFPCIVCGLVFPSEDRLTQHFHQHKLKNMTTKKSPWKSHLRCLTCGLQATTRKNFILHKCDKPTLDMSNIDATSDLTCLKCYRTFLTHERAKIHKALHGPDMPQLLSCLQCNISVPTEKMLQSHVAIIHDKIEHRCEDCGLRFMEKHHLALHKRVHLVTKVQYQCSMCDRVFPNILSVNRHLAVHNNENEDEDSKEDHNCGKCGKTFTSRAHLQHHLENEHDSMGRMPALIQYQCKVCCERVTSSSEVLVHRTSHWKSSDPALPYVCEYCGEAHASPNGLARHRRYLHPDEKPYVCTFCGTTTRTLYEARVHRKTHTTNTSNVHDLLTKTYQCEHCQNVFTDKQALNVHKKTHKHAKLFECEFCQKVFPERHRLMVHRRQHTGDKPFACGTCGKKFAQTSAMYTHALLHTGEMPHACDICDRRFRIKSDRDTHRRTHTGEKPYKCNFCGKSFRAGQVYYQHRMIHTGERRFPCDICGRAFKRSHTLVCHKRIHTGEKPNVCHVCGKGFRQRTDMRKHKRTIHNITS